MVPSKILNVFISFAGPTSWGRNARVLCVAKRAYGSLLFPAQELFEI